VAPRVATKDKSIWVEFEQVSEHSPQWIEQWNKQIGR
jgi:putative spermidine/putrescine transport system substrate-binding protein